MQEQQEIELAKSQKIAFVFFVAAVALFVGGHFFAHNVWSAGVIAFSEAAMVGALADWFAVTALFRNIRLLSRMPVIKNHTAIIPNNKDRIAENLAAFVREKFFNVDSISQLIRKHDPAKQLSDWLVAPHNAETLGNYLLKFFSETLKFIDDKPVKAFLLQTLRSLLGNINLSKSFGELLGTLTQGNKHQTLLDEALNQFASFLDNAETQQLIAHGIERWLKTEHSIIETFLPTPWVGEKGAAIAVSAFGKIVKEINEDKNHTVRQRFDAFVAEFIERLKNDPTFIAKGEEIKEYIQNDEKLAAYVSSIWGQIHDWLKADLEDADSVIHKKIVMAGQWLGKALSDDSSLRDSINRHLEESARNMAPDFAEFLTKHIENTVKGWDAASMAHQLELQIGKDLQFIRINGTVIGGFIGLIIFGFSWLIRILA